MEEIKILIAENSYLIREGLKAIIHEHANFKLVGEAEKAEKLSEKLLKHPPDVLIIDYSSRYYCLDDVRVIHEHFPKVRILAITNWLDKETFLTAIEYGVTSHLLKGCGKDEIVAAIKMTAKGKKYVCPKIKRVVSRKMTKILL